MIAHYYHVATAHVPIEVVAYVLALDLVCVVVYCIGERRRRREAALRRDALRGKGGW